MSRPSPHAPLTGVSVAELDADRRERERLSRERPEGFPRDRWTVAQAAYEMGVTAAHVRKLCRSGELAADRWIGKWAIPPGAVGGYESAQLQEQLNGRRDALSARLDTLESVVRNTLMVLAVMSETIGKTMGRYGARIPEPDLDE